MLKSLILQQEEIRGLGMFFILPLRWASLHYTEKQDKGAQNLSIVLSIRGGLSTGKSTAAATVTIESD